MRRTASEKMEIIRLVEGDRIARLRDDLDPEAQKAMGEWMAAHAALLQGASG